MAKIKDKDIISQAVHLTGLDRDTVEKVIQSERTVISEMLRVGNSVHFGGLFSLKPKYKWLPFLGCFEEYIGLKLRFTPVLRRILNNDHLIEKLRQKTIGETGIVLEENFDQNVKYETTTWG